MSGRRQKTLPCITPGRKVEEEAPFRQDKMISIPQASGIVGFRRLAPKPDATRNSDKHPRAESESPPVKRQRVPLLQDLPDMLQQTSGSAQSMHLLSDTSGSAQSMHLMSDIEPYMSNNLPEGIPDIGIGNRFSFPLANIIQPTTSQTTPSLFDLSTTTSYQYPSHENNIQTSDSVYPHTFQFSPPRLPVVYLPTPAGQICASCDARLRHLRQGIMKIPNDALKLTIMEIYHELRDNWHGCSKRGLEVGGL